MVRWSIPTTQTPDPEQEMLSLLIAEIQVVACLLAQLRERIITTAHGETPALRITGAIRKTIAHGATIATTAPGVNAVRVLPTRLHRPVPTTVRLVTTAAAGVEREVIRQVQDLEVTEERAAGTNSNSNILLFYVEKNIQDTPDSYSIA